MIVVRRFGGNHYGTQRRISNHQEQPWKIHCLSIRLLLLDRVAQLYPGTWFQAPRPTYVLCALSQCIG